MSENPVLVPLEPCLKLSAAEKAEVRELQFQVNHHRDLMVQADKKLSEFLTACAKAENIDLTRYGFDLVNLNWYEKK